MDAPAHKVFLVIDADTADQVEAAVAPIIDIGCATFHDYHHAADLGPPAQGHYSPGGSVAGVAVKFQHRCFSTPVKS